MNKKDWFAACGGGVIGATIVKLGGLIASWIAVNLVTSLHVFW